MKIKLHKEEVTNLYNSGMSHRKIAKALGVSGSVIARFTAKHNIKARPFHRPKTHLNREQVASMYESGMTMQKIGEALGVSDTLIYRFMKKHNIKSRKSFRQNKE